MKKKILSGLFDLSDLAVTNVTGILSRDRDSPHLIQASRLLHELFEAKQAEKFARLDQEFELLVGHKERALVALRQHAQEHQCQTARAA